MKSKGKKVKINKNNMIEPDNIIDNDSKQELKSLNNLPDTEQKDKVNFPNIYSNSKFLTPSSKQINNQSKILNLNMKKINKLYVSSNHKNDKDKNSNEFNKISVLSKITKRDYSNRNNANKILEALNSSSNKNINKLERKYPSPSAPNPAPGVPTTWISVRSLSKKAQLPICPGQASQI